MDLAFSFNLTFADIMLKCDVSKNLLAGWVPLDSLQPSAHFLIQDGGRIRRTKDDVKDYSALALHKCACTPALHCTAIIADHRRFSFPVPPDMAHPNIQFLLRLFFFRALFCKFAAEVPSLLLIFCACSSFAQKTLRKRFLCDPLLSFLQSSSSSCRLRGRVRLELL